MSGERTTVGAWMFMPARSRPRRWTGPPGRCSATPWVPNHEAVLGWLARLPGPVAVTYEAGPTGFGLARALQAARVRCVVVAPSKLERPPGDRVKTDPEYLSCANNNGLPTPAGPPSATSATTATGSDMVTADTPASARVSSPQTSMTRR